jgi:hypothetical protein
VAAAQQEQLEVPELLGRVIQAEHQMSALQVVVEAEPAL